MRDGSEHSGGRWEEGVQMTRTIGTDREKIKILSSKGRLVT
jgi:hypothetical protein